MSAHSGINFPPIIIFLKRKFKSTRSTFHFSKDINVLGKGNSSNSFAMNTYHNPIIPGFNPDPSIIRKGSDFYLVTSSFEYFPGIPIYHSTDLIKWSLIGHALTRRSQLDIRTPEPGGGVWAATIREHDGWFYVMTACFDRYRPQNDDRVWPRGFYVKTRDIWEEESWSEPVYFDQVGFDQDVSFLFLDKVRVLR
jgi:beta-xylosidase